MAKKSAATELIACLARACADDLGVVDATIAKLEAELATLVADKKKAIDSLRAVRKTIDLAVNGKPARKTPVRKKNLNQRLNDLPSGASK